MTVKCLYSRGFGSNCYIVTDDALQNAVVVDPSVPYQEAVSLLGFAPRFHAILLTHGHADHFLALSSWKENTAAEIMIGAFDAHALDNPEASCASFLGLGDFRYSEPVSRLNDKDEVGFGDERLQVIASPGHSPGSVCYYSPGHLLAGDTIFAEGGVGRSDLYGGDEQMLYDSISELIKLPKETVVYPGHGPLSTIAEQARFHRYLL